MDATREPAAATPRRRFLRLLALAPAAAACAGAGAAGKAPAGAGPAAAASPGKEAAAPPPDPLAPIREFPLPTGSEPAFVFRAALARPRI
jgi:hypothetical protein